MSLKTEKMVTKKDHDNICINKWKWVQRADVETLYTLHNYLVCIIYNKDKITQQKAHTF